MASTYQLPEWAAERLAEQLGGVAVDEESFLPGSPGVFESIPLVALDLEAAARGERDPNLLLVAGDRWLHNIRTIESPAELTGGIAHSLAFSEVDLDSQEVFLEEVHRTALAETLDTRIAELDAADQARGSDTFVQALDGSPWHLLALWLKDEAGDSVRVLRAPRGGGAPEPGSLMDLEDFLEALRAMVPVVGVGPW